MPIGANNIAVILDWSNLMYRSLFVNSMFRTAATYDLKEDVDAFMGKFCIDVTYILKTFKPTVAIIAKDAHKPWRAGLLEGVNEGYKGTRHKDMRINWDNIYKGSDELITLFEKHGMHLAYADHAEADDIMGMCKEVGMASQVQGTVIVSADADIKQLACFDPTTKKWCAVYNTIAKGKSKAREMYVTQGFLDWLNAEQANDIFSFGVDLPKQAFRNMLQENPAIKLVPIDPGRVAVDKIFCGDDGDNVPSMYEWWDKGKKQRITPGRCKKIVEALHITSPDDLGSKLPLLQETIEGVIKREVNDIDITERVNRQRQLVELNSSMFPESVRSYKDTVTCMMQDEVNLDYTRLKARDIINGTALGDSLDKKRNVIEKSVFNDIDRYTQKLEKLF